ncbi:DUF6350 family protein [Bifidobacterium apri]
MKERCVSFVKGVVFAAASMALYALALWLLISLLFLVISMEEGTDNLTDYAFPLTQSMILLSQGIGFQSKTITLSVIPLTLTVLMLWLLASLARRHKLSLAAYLGGLMTWVSINMAFTYHVSVGLLDNIGIVAVKTGMVFTLAFLLGAFPVSQRYQRMKTFADQHVSRELKRALSLGVALGMTLLAIYMLVACIDVVVWIIYGWDAVSRIFELDAMGVGSRIMTSVCSLAWLPNLCIWSLSWIFGSGFRIGELAHFTMWIGQSTDLPGLPLFGIFPQAIGNDGLRTFLLSLPLIISIVCALAFMLSPTGFAIRAPHAGDNRDTVVRHVITFAYPLGAFCISGALVALGSSCMFALSNGALGAHRLAHVGVDVVASASAVGHPTIVGLFATWAAVIVADAAWYGLRLCWSRLRPAKNRSSTEHTADGQPRGVTSTPVNANMTTTTKEEQDGINEQAD